MSIEAVPEGDEQGSRQNAERIGPPSKQWLRRYANRLVATVRHPHDWSQEDIHEWGIAVGGPGAWFNSSPNEMPETLAEEAAEEWDESR